MVDKSALGYLSEDMLYCVSKLRELKQQPEWKSYVSDLQYMLKIRVPYIPDIDNLPEMFKYASEIEVNEKKDIDRLIKILLDIMHTITLALQEA